MSEKEPISAKIKRGNINFNVKPPKPEKRSIIRENLIFST